MRFNITIELATYFANGDQFDRNTCGSLTEASEEVKIFEDEWKDGERWELLINGEVVDSSTNE